MEIEKLVCLTAYTAPMARLLDPHCDYLLVGDSVAMVLYGEETTRSATIEMMIAHGRAVAKATQIARVIVDLPYGSYEGTPDQALQTARQVMDKTGAYGVKLEGGKSIAAQIAHITDHNIPVMSHIGLLPQHVEDSNGYKVQGRENAVALALIEDAHAVEKSGAFAVVIEAVPEPLAAKITQSITIPTIGIGASAACGGQILVTEDMLGLSGPHVPKFVKQYAHLEDAIKNAVKGYADDVRCGVFPSEAQTYKANKSKAQTTYKTKKKAA